MTVVDETKVRDLAYQLWEQHGHQSGKDEDYWHAAEKLLADDGEMTSQTAANVPLIPLSTGLK